MDFKYRTVMAANERIAELMRNELFIADLRAENERLRQALKRIAPTSCPRCGDRSIQQIARDALREGE